MFKKFLAIFFIFVFCTANLNSYAELVVDDSIHEEISKKYELDKLPELPKSLQNSTIDDIFTPSETETLPQSKYTPQQTNTPQDNEVSSPPPTQNLNEQTKSAKAEKPKFKAASSVRKIPKGKKFKVVNSAELSDTLRAGASVKFVSTATETFKYITVPKGTVFNGVVIKSHSPQFTGNGGLLVIKVNSMILNGKTYPLNAKLTIANSKHVFFNKVKGKRLYIKNAVKSTAKGKSFYDKMWAGTKKYFKLSPTIILSAITFVSGTVVYVANIAISPALAIFTKGGKLYIPKNSKFEIKMLDDAFVN